ncbi:hypothetical protein [Streptacidiphilus sp. EB103A]|uniref:hypothetical protein n=1 Tax=Streptacidiphilus sp. EB103A TaxID=3156275 RepID=UPI003516136E
MALTTMDGCRAKLRRAERHLQDYEDSLRVFSATHPVRVTVERNVAEKAFTFHVHDVEPCDPQWSLIIGDCVHNARSALDQLFYQLTVQSLGRDLTEGEEKQPQFPVAKDRASWRKIEKNYQKLGVAADYLKRLEEIQPFNGWDKQIWGQHEMPGPPGPIASYLDELTKLNNADKHRLLTPVWWGVGLGGLPQGFAGLGGTGGSTTGDPLVEGGLLGQWHFDAAPPEIPADFKPELYWTFHPSLRFPYFGTNVSRILDNCITAARMILDMFEPSVLRGQPPADLPYWNGRKGL